MRNGGNTLEITVIVLRPLLARTSEIGCHYVCLSLSWSRACRGRWRRFSPLLHNRRCNGNFRRLFAHPDSHVVLRCSSFAWRSRHNSGTGISHFLTCIVVAHCFGRSLPACVRRAGAIFRRLVSHFRAATMHALCRGAGLAQKAITTTLTLFVATVRLTLHGLDDSQTSRLGICATPENTKKARPTSESTGWELAPGCNARGCCRQGSGQSAPRKQSTAEQTLLFPSCFSGAKRSKSENLRAQLLDAGRSRQVFRGFLPSQNSAIFLFLQCRFPLNSNSRYWSCSRNNWSKQRLSKLELRTLTHSACSDVATSQDRQRLSKAKIRTRNFDQMSLEELPLPVICLVLKWIEGLTPERLVRLSSCFSNRKWVRACREDVPWRAALSSTGCARDFPACGLYRWFVYEYIRQLTKLSKKCETASRMCGLVCGLAMDCMEWAELGWGTRKTSSALVQ